MRPPRILTARLTKARNALRVALGGSDRHDEPHIQLKALDKEEVQAAAAGEALAHVLSRPDSIRQRAQSAATISSAVVAALLIAGLSQFSGGKLSLLPEGIALLLALVLWVAGVWLFIYAVAFIDKGTESPLDYQALVTSYERYADEIRARIRRAATISGVALVATVLAMGLAEVKALKSSPDVRMHIRLTKDGAAAVGATCSWAADATRLEGLVASADLRQPLVQIKDVTLLTTTLVRPTEPNPGKCVDEGVDIRVPRSAIHVARNTNP